ncbi:dihydrofolate reductase family protein [Deinococcus koreensis]|uniref:Pyrimidine reductase n=1 Tax=Deinococcus koreensis TaxID=2054903 RepID=A0A2K3UWP6_9DEIO|nr:dihydrofolate reductase family protein [Deinococcus koreensis]PNY80958.1 pyrimidine reductase [Deinococcus koreensis]
MGKIVISEFLSLDGVMENPVWTVPYRNDDGAAFKRTELFASDALLLGRVTYQGFAEAWPSQTDEQGFADRMNGLPKHVVSTTLQGPEWNNSVVIGKNVAEEVARLRAQPGGDILVYGSGELTRFLLEQGLVDQLNLLVYPLTLGAGKRLFGETPVKLRLTESRTFTSGVVLLVYTPETTS